MNLNPRHVKGTAAHTSKLHSRMEYMFSWKGLTKHGVDIDIYIYINVLIVSKAHA